MQRREKKEDYMGTIQIFILFKYLSVGNLLECLSLMFHQKIYKVDFKKNPKTSQSNLMHIYYNQALLNFIKFVLGISTIFRIRASGRT